MESKLSLSVFEITFIFSVATLLYCLIISFEKIEVIDEVIAKVKTSIIMEKYIVILLLIFVIFFIFIIITLGDYSIKGIGFQRQIQLIHGQKCNICRYLNKFEIKFIY